MVKTPSYLFTLKLNSSPTNRSFYVPPLFKASQALKLITSLHIQVLFFLFFKVNVWEYEVGYIDSWIGSLH